MPDPKRDLYDALCTLEHQARAARRKAGLSSSRREAAAALGKRPGGTSLLSSQRISSWLPRDPALAQIPRDSDADRLLALVQVWSGWAGTPVPERWWRDLIEAAQPERARRLPPRPTSQSAYLQQVLRIAPPNPPGLLGREDELNELSRFCLEPGRDSYVWWQAGPWAGKSALLSTFVLHPPPEVADRTRIVSFFVTARLDAGNARDAFTQTVAEQLAELTGQELPSVLPDATREGFLRDLLAQAARACQQDSGRLILVVDGLDEDRGVTAGPHANSIAALLPMEPPSGMRVIVAGRLDPPIPDDVPSWHPLHNPAIVQPLARSRYARDVQRLAKQELRRLQHGTELEQDLLGLLAAAGDGLSAYDLEELTGAPLGEIEEILQTVTGRTFTSRVSRWSPGAGPQIYLLGHEELQYSALRYIGRRVSDYHERLHSWADNYRKRGWPDDTPEYLVSGYYRLLAFHGDLPRMVACATDTERHECLLRVTGGDSFALAEIRDALDLLAAGGEPDLASGLNLACLRDMLNDRNSSIPTGLPATWATLGQVTRAEALASSITDPNRQVQALMQVAAELSQAGQSEQASRLIVQATNVAGSITDSRLQAQALQRTQADLAAVRNPRQGGTAARPAGDRSPRSEKLARVVEAVAAGNLDRAHEIAHSISRPDQQAQALAQVARAFAAAGLPQQAVRVSQQAEAIACSITSVTQQAEALAQLAGALAGPGLEEQATRVALQSGAVARSITRPDRQAEALAQVAGQLAGAGLEEQATEVALQAEAVARSITRPDRQAQALAQLAGALGRAGQHRHGEAVAQWITNPHSRAQGLAQVAGAIAWVGQADRAEAVALSIDPSHQKAEALAQVAGALAAAGQLARADQIAGSIEEERQQAWVKGRLAGALAAAGELIQARQMASSIREKSQKAQALAQIAWALARNGHKEQALELCQEAEKVAEYIGDPERRTRVSAQIAGTRARAGDHEHAEKMARSISGGNLQGAALARVVGGLAGAGQFEQAELIARSISDPYRQATALTEVARALAGAGEAARAETVAQSISHPYRRSSALAQVAVVLARSGHRRLACRVAMDVCSSGHWTVAAAPVLWLDPSAFSALAQTLNSQWHVDISLT